MSINEKMTAIADAIREKTGGTDTLTLDQMAAAIAGLQIGSGSVSKMSWGTFTTTAKVNANTINIEHGLGCAPDLFVVFTTTRQSSLANRGVPMVVVDAFTLRRITPSSSNEASFGIITEEEITQYLTDTNFVMVYGYLSYGVGDHIWIAIKRGT